MTQSTVYARLPAQKVDSSPLRAEPVGALGEAGLRGSAGAPTDASSKRPASSEGDRRAEEGSTLDFQRNEFGHRRTRYPAAPRRRCPFPWFRVPVAHPKVKHTSSY